MRWLRKWEGSRLAIAGLCVAAILFVALNVLAGATLRGAQVDLTERSLYTVSAGSRSLLASLQEPVHLRLYFSRNLGQAAPRFAEYYARVRELLERYVTLSNGKLSLELLEPEPFSEAEDRAVADGLQGVPLSQAGDIGYFGLAGSNTLDGRAVIPFFNLEREPFLEYDLTKLVHGLGNPDRPVLGVLSALPREPGGMGHPPGAPPPLLILDQIADFFTVETLDPSVSSIPDRVKALMVVDLRNLSPEALRAVDRFVHAGDPALVFVDPVVESSGGVPASGTPAPQADVDRLLASWGLTLVPDKVAGDIETARRVATGERGTIGDYLAWMSLGRDNFDTNDPVMGNIERLNFATAGILQPVEGASVKVTPLVFTSPRSMPIPVAEVRFMPDILGLLRKFEPGDTPLVLAARVSGPASAAFADAGTAPPAGGDAPQPGDATAEPKSPPTAGSETPSGQETHDIQLIVVADADMLYDRFWMQRSDFFGEQVDVPTAGNGDFVINALENLSDARTLIGLRGRGTSYRPFTLVEEIRRDAEAKFRAKEQQLQQRLKELQQELAGVQRRGDGQAGEIMLSESDTAAIERFRTEMIVVRKELREVQHALRRDIESLETEVKFVNIAAVPLVLCGVGGGLALFRRMRRARAKRQPERR
jgi:ABC-type uncharacterized transport system involved in gliding motility auxiliary subunit